MKGATGLRNFFSPARRTWPFAVATLIWLVAVALGLGILERHASTPGRQTDPPRDWPSKTQLLLGTHRRTLVMFAHPHCPCSRASAEELARIMAAAQGRVAAHVVFVLPKGFTEDWAQTDLWRTVSQIPGVTAVRDPGGMEAQRFGALTSGQTLLYDSHGNLLFSGGITSARGHAGDNAGRDAIVAMLRGDQTETVRTRVFGCALSNSN